MQMKVGCSNLEETQDTTHHGQMDGFLKNWSGRKTLNRFKWIVSLPSSNNSLLEIDFKVNCYQLPIPLTC